jgi:GrpB-like predicted nucleotidyltransferase (UPF0157 family)
MRFCSDLKIVSATEHHPIDAFVCENCPESIVMTGEPLETGLIGGIEKRDIIIAEYDSTWPALFAKHAKIIAGALGSAARRIEHIGSTSVPGLAAKPIIDILVVVKDSAEESVYLRQMEAAGYVLRVREPDWYEHRMFRTSDKDVHVHIYSDGCPEITRTLTFRDRLRRNSDDRTRYEQTKRQLATQDWSDMNAYAQAKTVVIEDVIAASQTAGEISQSTLSPVILPRRFDGDDGANG